MRRMPSARPTADVLRAMGVIVYEPDRADALARAVAGAGHQCFSSNRSAAVLIGQHIIGAKTWGKDE